MLTSIIMPKTGMAMETGILIRWLKKEGDAIEKGDIIAEIETDKSTMELESDGAGILLKVLADEGAVIPVAQIIAWVGDKDDAIPEPDNVVQPQSPPVHSQETPSYKSDKSDKILATPLSKKMANEMGIDLSTVIPSGSYGQIISSDISSNNVSATPLAQKIASDQNVDLKKLSNDVGGRKIRKDDVLNSISHTSDSVVEDTVVPLTNIQKITGLRMSKSASEIPSVTEFAVADVSKMLDIRKELNCNSELKITINDIVVLATVKAIEKNRRVNAVLGEGVLHYKANINIGIATSTENGLVVPVLKDANRLTLSQLSNQIKGLTSKAREKKLSMSDMEGSTFTISNVGMFRIRAFTPIINQPEVAILGIGAIEEVLKLGNDGSLSTNSLIHLSLTFDHRALDGHEASVFFKDLIEYLENPLSMLV